MSTEGLKRKRETHLGIIERINVVKKFIISPCDPDPIVYVETVWEPLGTMVVSLLSFGMTDVVRGYYRPKGTRKQKRYRGRRPRTIRIGGKKVKVQIPEIGNRIGQNLAPEKIRNRKVSKGVEHLWKLDGVGQRVLWYWLVADVTSEFAYSWSSAIIESKCRPEELHRSRVAASGPTVKELSQGFTPIPAPSPEYIHNMEPNNSGYRFLPGAKYGTVGVTIQIEKVDGEGEEVTFSMSNEADTKNQTIILEPGKAIDFLVTGFFSQAVLLGKKHTGNHVSFLATVGWYQIDLEDY